MSITVNTEPVRHLHLVRALPVEIADALRDSLEKATSWFHVRQSFYEVDVLANLDRESIFRRPEVAVLLGRVRDCAESELGLRLSRRAQLHVHRFTKGTGAGLHSDSGESGARLVVFLEGGWQEGDGGELLLVNNGGVRGKLISPRHNTAVLFLTEAGSLHAVTEQRSGVRYSLVFHLPLAGDRDQKDQKSISSVADSGTPGPSDR